MFHSAVVKLTLWYVSALVIVCAMFSLPLYLLTSQRLERGANRQIEFFQSYSVGGFRRPPDDDIVIQRNSQLDEDRHQLLVATIAANISVIILGTSFSYLFARRTLRPIEEMHDAQTRFTADASHELRTPLAVMQTEIEIALRDKSTSEKEIRGILKSNLEEVARLRQLSDQLLDLTKLDIDTLQKNTFSLSDAINEEITEQSNRHNLKIASKVAKDITIHGAETLIRQVLSILIDNARKYAGSVGPKISLSLEKHGKTAVIRCTDKGIGISEEDLPKIFDRFYRGSNATNGGHGLGLSLAKEIILKHHGAITASSKPGTTTFIITLPT